MTAYLYRMPVGIAGAISRPQDLTVEPVILKSANAFAAYGLAGKYDADGFFVPLADGDTADKVKGIYVPFWLYDTDASADIRYKATKTRFWSDNDYDYTETSYYAVHRSGSLGFDHVPVDGSASMENDLMESIEPFDFKEAVDFQTAYLAGYFADKYDVTAEECEGRANERIRHSTEDAFRDTVRGYSSVVPENTSIRLHNGTTKYALYPVWILQTKWKGDNYIFAMNGQTGKFVGNLPTDKNAFARWFLGTTGVVGVITYIILYLIWAL